MAKTRKPLTADDGTPLKAKEAIVLDPEGNTVFEPQSPTGHDAHQDARVRVLRVGWPLGLLLALALPLFLVGGLAVLAILAAALLLTWSLRAITRSLFR